MKSALVNTTEKQTLVLLTNLFIALSLFSYGTAMMDYFLVYPSRLIVGEPEFISYHSLLEERILPISVIPFALMTILNVVLVWKRPTFVAGTLVWLSMICLLLDWVSSLTLQIPMNLQLNHGKDTALIQSVMDTNYGRIFLETAQAFIAFLMMCKYKKPAYAPRNTSF